MGSVICQFIERRANAQKTHNAALIDKLYSKISN